MHCETAVICVKLVLLLLRLFDFGSVSKVLMPVFFIGEKSYCPTSFDLMANHLLKAFLTLGAGQIVKVLPQRDC